MRWDIQWKIGNLLQQDPSIPYGRRLKQRQMPSNYRVRELWLGWTKCTGDQIDVLGGGFGYRFGIFAPPKRKWGITELKRSKNSISRFLKIGLKFCCLDLFGVTIPSWKNLGVWKVMKTFQRHFRGQGNHPTPKVAPVYHFSIHVQPSKGKTASCHHWWHTWINHLRRGGGAVQFGCSVLGSSADQS